MPFITEEIYQALPHDCESIMISEYPAFNGEQSFEDANEQMERIISAIKAIRNRRSEMNVVPSRKAKVYIVTSYTDSFNEDTAVFFGRLASASEVEITDRPETFEGVVSADNAVQIITDSATIYLPLSDIIDTEKEMARLTAEEKKLIGEIDRIEKKLSNEGFVAKAPAAVVEAERAKLTAAKEKMAATQAALAKLG
jgi:valyl-tRNA synthetase